MTEPKPTETAARPRLDSSVIDEVNKAYYSRLIDAPDKARARALNGFTVASAIVAALVAAGLAKGLGDASALLRAVGCGALVLWLLAGASYVAAVAGWQMRKWSPQSANDANDAAWNRIEETKRDLASIRLATGIAQAFSILALAMTLALIGIAVLQNGSSRRVAVTLTAKGAREVATACGWARRSSPPSTTFRVRLDAGSLGDRFTALRFDAGACREQAAEVLVGTGDIRLVTSTGD